MKIEVRLCLVCEAEMERDMSAPGRPRLTCSPACAAIYGRVAKRIRGTETDEEVAARVTYKFVGEPTPESKRRYFLTPESIEDAGRRAERAERAIAAYAYDDMTLEQIGARWSVSRERIRQIIERHDPGLYALAKHRRRARSRMRHYVNDHRVVDMRHCDLCGEAYPPASSSQRFCSPIHYSAYMSLRYHINDEYRDKARLASARWHVANVPDRGSYHDRLLAGEVESRGRWLIVGSVNFHWAVRACACDWPVFAELHPDIQRQVREHLYGAETTA